MTISKFCEIRETLLNECEVEIPANNIQQIVWLLNTSRCYCFALPSQHKNKTTLFLDMQRYMSEGSENPEDF